MIVHWKLLMKAQLSFDLGTQLIVIRNEADAASARYQGTSAMVPAVIYLGRLRAHFKQIFWLGITSLCF